MSGAFAPPRSKRAALVTAAALAAASVVAVNAVPASGLVGPAGLRAGKSITVLHNIDMVAVIGYPLGSQVTVKVVRDGVIVGSATGASRFTLDGPGLEINHGVEGGTPQPGDCWDGHTPDIRPGDHIIVTDGAGKDEVVVDDIHFDGPPDTASDGDVVVPFTAVDARGTAIPLSRLDSAAFRDDQLRYEADAIALEARPGGSPGEYQMRYESSPTFTPTRNGDDSPDEEPPLTQDQIARALLGDGHTIGFGHVAPLPEGMLVDGIADASAPAPGCEAVAPKMSHGVTAATPGLINELTPADTQLRVSGFSDTATDVDVRLRDADTTVTSTVSVAASTDTWRASFPATDLTDLSGIIKVTAVADGTASALTKTVLKDTVAPAAPSASLPAGSYRGPQLVALTGGSADRIRFTLGDGTQPAPTATRGTLYGGGDIRIATSQTLKTIAVDGAGNVSPVVQLRYQILRPPTAPRIERASAGDPGGRTTASAAWLAPLANNGGAVTGYRVTALRLRADNSVASRRAFPVERPRARALQMRLAEGRYAFRVRAINEFGASPMSALSNVVLSR